MNRTVFRIPRMDCASEERIIRMKLEDAPEIFKLDFDLPQRTLTAFHSNPPQVLLGLLEPLNFGAVISITDTVDEASVPETQENTLEEARVLKALLLINGGMFFVELITGLLAESMGLISDSLDMFADASVYGVSLYAVGKTLTTKKRSAKLNGSLQVILGIGVIIETVRKFIFGSDPEPNYMIGISICALIANIYCLWLLSKHKEGGVHMKASYICSSTDVMANAGVIIAGILVMMINSSIPDLLIGSLVALIVLRGGFTILKL